MRATHSETKTSVLIVDGDRWQGEVLAAAFAYEGYRSEQVDNAASALDTLTRRHFRLVVLDLSAPSAGGWETVEKLILLYPDLPVIVLAPGEGTMRSQALSGASTVISKPINFSALRHALKRALTPPAETFVVHCFEGRGARMPAP